MIQPAFSRRQRATFPRLMALLALCGLLLWRAAPPAEAQAVTGPTQTLVIGYPNSGVVSGRTGSPLYKGLVYVSIYPADAALIQQSGAGPVATAELSPSGRDVRALPLGRYEVRFAVRDGSELSTFILRDVILRADRAAALTVEVNTGAKTTIVGGDLSAQQMVTLIRQLQGQVAELQKQVAALTPK